MQRTLERKLTIKKDDPFARIFIGKKLGSFGKSFNGIPPAVDKLKLQPQYSDAKGHMKYFPDFDGTKDSKAYAEEEESDDGLSEDSESSEDSNY